MIETIVKMEMTEIMTVFSFLEIIIRRRKNNNKNNEISTPEKNSYVCIILSTSILC